MKLIIAKELATNMYFFWNTINGGYYIDKRFEEGESLRNTVKSIDVNQLKLMGCYFNVHYSLTLLSLKERHLLLTSNICLN